jgi:hypothetical protein
MKLSCVLFAGLIPILFVPFSMNAAEQVSQPKYKMVVDKDVRIPLRDGGYLAADIYRPDAAGEKFPVLMSLSAYRAGPFDRIVLRSDAMDGGEPAAAASGHDRSLGRLGRPLSRQRVSRGHLQ